MRNDIANKDGIGARIRQTKRVTRKASMNVNQENQVTSSKMNINKAQKRSISENSLATATTSQTKKRTAFGDITNAIQAHANRMSIARSKSMSKDQKAEIKPELKKTELKRAKSLVTKEIKEPCKPKILPSTKRNTRLRTSQSSTSLPIVPIFVEELNKDVSKSDKEMSIDEQCEEILSCPVVLDDKSPGGIMDVSCKEVVEELPEGVIPFDLDDDPNVVSEYAADIFKNMKKREARFLVTNYLTREGTLTTGMMRAILVDWLVEVQENFELYHETLYFAVKIVDYYLQNNNNTPKEKLQLVGATALLIASKIEERQPPPLDDFRFICDDAYTTAQFKEMEIMIFKSLDFDVNMPISYRFLRRFSRVTQMKMEVLTLSRYILELSLHGAEFVDKLPSQMAASCLCLAMKMKDVGEWNPNHIYHSGYEEKELVAIMKSLNRMLINAPTHKLQTVRTKYSHPVHFEVAKTKTIDSSLFEELL